MPMRAGGPSNVHVLCAHYAPVVRNLYIHTYHPSCIVIVLWFGVPWSEFRAERGPSHRAGVRTHTMYCIV